MVGTYDYIILFPSQKEIMFVKHWLKVWFHGDGADQGGIMRGRDMLTEIF
jgi:hypothetical protein